MIPLLLVIITALLYGLCLYFRRSKIAACVITLSTILAIGIVTLNQFAPPPSTLESSEQFKIYAPEIQITDNYIHYISDHFGTIKSSSLTDVDSVCILPLQESTTPYIEVRTFSYRDTFYHLFQNTTRTEIDIYLKEFT